MSWYVGMSFFKKESLYSDIYCIIANDMTKRREIRNSTAEFLIFQIEGKEQGVEVYYKDKTVWCTQKAMGILFDCSTDNVSLHLKNIYKTKELKKSATAEKISVVRHEVQFISILQQNLL